MRYAIVSDIHANLDALDAVLKHAGNLPVICLGDIVGYGAQPNETVERIRSIATIVVLGNHDLACATGEGLDYFSPAALHSAHWTANRLTPVNARWLQNLPYVYVEHDTTYVHASPHQPNRFHYVEHAGDAKRALAASETSITFVGHHHHPGIFTQTGTHIGYQPLENNCTYHLSHTSLRAVVNAGSVGQPRDGNPLASYAVYDDFERTVTAYRVAYDVPRAQQRIRATQLPEDCAARLTFGR